MLSRLSRPALLEPLMATKHLWKRGAPRFLATVDSNTPRQMPVDGSRATPISRDRATFTIKVCNEQHNYNICPNLHV